jgi:hypothetical protein
MCKSHGKQEVDVQSFLPVEAEISVTKVRTDGQTEGRTNGRINGRTDKRTDGQTDKVIAI